MMDPQEYAYKMLQKNGYIKPNTTIYDGWQTKPTKLEDKQAKLNEKLKQKQTLLGLPGMTDTESTIDGKTYKDANKLYNNFNGMAKSQLLSKFAAEDQWILGEDGKLRDLSGNIQDPRDAGIWYSGPVEGNKTKMGYITPYGEVDDAVTEVRDNYKHFKTDDSANPTLSKDVAAMYGPKNKVMQLEAMLHGNKEALSNRSWDLYSKDPNRPKHRYTEIYNGSTAQSYLGASDTGESNLPKGAELGYLGTKLYRKKTFEDMSPAEQAGYLTQKEKERKIANEHWYDNGTFNPLNWAKAAIRGFTAAQVDTVDTGLDIVTGSYDRLVGTKDKDYIDLLGSSKKREDWYNNMGLKSSDASARHKAEAMKAASEFVGDFDIFSPIDTAHELKWNKAVDTVKAGFQDPETSFYSLSYVLGITAGFVEKAGVKVFEGIFGTAAKAAKTAKQLDAIKASEVAGKTTKEDAAILKAKAIENSGVKDKDALSTYVAGVDKLNDDLAKDVITQKQFKAGVVNLATKLEPVTEVGKYETNLAKITEQANVANAKIEQRLALTTDKADIKKLKTLQANKSKAFKHKAQKEFNILDTATQAKIIGKRLFPAAKYGAVIQNQSAENYLENTKKHQDLNQLFIGTLINGVAGMLDIKVTKMQIQGIDSAEKLAKWIKTGVKDKNLATQFAGAVASVTGKATMAAAIEMPQELTQGFGEAFTSAWRGLDENKEGLSAHDAIGSKDTLDYAANSGLAGLTMGVHNSLARSAITGVGPALNAGTEALDTLVDKAKNRSEDTADSSSTEEAPNEFTKFSDSLKTAISKNTKVPFTNAEGNEEELTLDTNTVQKNLDSLKTEVKDANGDVDKLNNIVDTHPLFKVLDQDTADKVKTQFIENPDKVISYLDKTLFKTDKSTKVPEEVKMFSSSLKTAIDNNKNISVLGANGVAEDLTLDKDTVDLNLDTLKSKVDKAKDDAGKLGEIADSHPLFKVLSTNEFGQVKKQFKKDPYSVINYLTDSLNNSNKTNDNEELTDFDKKEIYETAKSTFNNASALLNKKDGDFYSNIDNAFDTINSADTIKEFGKDIEDDNKISNLEESRDKAINHVSDSLIQLLANDEVDETKVNDALEVISNEKTRDLIKENVFSKVVFSEMFGDFKPEEIQNATDMFDNGELNLDDLEATGSTKNYDDLIPDDLPSSDSSSIDLNAYDLEGADANIDSGTSNIDTGGAVNYDHLEGLDLNGLETESDIYNDMGKNDTNTDTSKESKSTGTNKESKANESESTTGKQENDATKDKANKESSSTYKRIKKEIFKHENGSAKQTEDYTIGTSDSSINKIAKKLGLSKETAARVIKNTFQNIKIRKMADVGTKENSAQRDLYYGEGKNGKPKGIIPTMVEFKKALQEADVKTAYEAIRGLQKTADKKEVEYNKLNTAYNEIKTELTSVYENAIKPKIDENTGKTADGKTAKQLLTTVAKNMPSSKKFGGITINPKSIVDEVIGGNRSNISKQLESMKTAVGHIDMALTGESRDFTRVGDQGYVINIDDDIKLAKSTLDKTKKSIDKLSKEIKSIDISTKEGKASKKLAAAQLAELRTKLTNYTEKTQRLEDNKKVINDVQEGNGIPKDSQYTLNNRWVSVSELDNERPEVKQWILEHKGLPADSRMTKETPTDINPDLAEKIDGYEESTVDNIVPKASKEEIPEIVKEIKESDAKMTEIETEISTEFKNRNDAKEQHNADLVEQLGDTKTVHQYKAFTNAISHSIGRINDLVNKRSKVEEDITNLKNKIVKYKDSIDSDVKELETLKQAREDAENLPQGTEHKRVKAALNAIARKMKKAANWTVANVKALYKKYQKSIAEQDLQKLEKNLEVINANIKIEENNFKKDNIKKKAKLVTKVVKKEQPELTDTKEIKKAMLSKIQKVDKLLNDNQVKLDNSKVKTSESFEKLNKLRDRKKELLGQLKGKDKIEHTINNGITKGKENFSKKDMEYEQPLNLLNDIKIGDTVVGRLSSDDILQLIPKSDRDFVNSLFNQVEKSLKNTLLVQTNQYTDSKGKQSGDINSVNNNQLLDSPALGLVVDSLDTNSVTYKPKGKTVGNDTYAGVNIGEAAKNAIALSVMDFIGTGIPDLIFNDYDTIARMRDKVHSGLLNKGEKKLLREGGYRKLIAYRLGSSILRNMGIKPNKDMQLEHWDKLVQDIGQMGLLTAQDMGFIKNIENSKIDGKVWERDIEELEELSKNPADVPMIYANNAEKNSDNYTLYAEKSKSVNEAIELTPYLKDYNTKRPNNKDKVYRVVDSYATAPDEDQNLMRKLEREEYNLLTDSMADFKEVFKNRQDYLDAAGWLDIDAMTNSGKELIEDIESQEGKNRQIEKEYDTLIDLDTAINQGKINNGLWFDWFFSKNGRLFLDSVGINPQVGKTLHRWLVTPKSGTRKWNLKDDIDKLEFDIAIAQAFDFDIDKEDVPAIQDKAKELLSMEDSELKAMIKTVPHIGHAVMAYTAIKKAKESDEFTTALASEFDAVTSGFAIKLMQVPGLNKKKLYAYLAKTGIFKPENIANLGLKYKGELITKEDITSGKIGMGEIISDPGFTDAYQTLALGAKSADKGSSLVVKEKDEDGKLKTNREDSAILNGLLTVQYKNDKGKDQFIMEPMTEEKAGVEAVTKFGRNLFKYPFMTFNYAASINSIRKSMKDTLAKDVLRAIVKGNLNMDNGSDVLKKLFNKDKEFNKDKLEKYREQLAKEADVTKLEEYKRLSKIFDGSYGRLTDDFMSTEFEPLVDANAKIIGATKVMFAMFESEFKKKVEEFENTNKTGLTEDKLTEIIMSLKERFPFIKAPFSKGLEDSMSIVDSKLVSANSNKLGLAQTTTKSTDKSKKVTSLKVQSMLRELKEAKAAGAVIPIHWLDGSIITKVLNQGGILGVHDAIVVFNKSLENAKTMNKAMYDINKGYDLIGNIMESLLDSVEGLDISEVEIETNDGPLMASDVIQQLHDLYKTNLENRKELYSDDLVIGNIAGPGQTIYNSSSDGNEYKDILKSKNKVDLKSIIDNAIKDC